MAVPRPLDQGIKGQLRAPGHIPNGPEHRARSSAALALAPAFPLWASPRSRPARALALP